MKSFKVVAVIPAYNEERTGKISETIIKTKKYADKVIVVDDGSIDDTFKIAMKAGAQTVRYEMNQGVLYATHVGIKEALRAGASSIVILDADGQHDPKYIPKFISKLNQGCDYVYGKRDISNYPINRKVGNFGLTMLAGMFCPTGIKDTECGYRALSRNAAEKIKLYYSLRESSDKKPKGYEREMNFIYEVWRNGLKVGRVDLKAGIFHPKKAFVRGIKNFFWLFEKRFGLI